MTLTVLHVVEAFSTGIIQSIRTICRALDGEVGFHVLYGRRPETPADVERQYPATVGFTPWSAAGRAIDPGKDRRAIAELRDTVARVKPDIIHAHSSKAGAYARLAYRRGEIPVLYSPRGYSFLQLDKSAATRAVFGALEWGLGRLPHITVGCGLGEYSLARTVAHRAVLIPNMIDPADFPAPGEGLAPDPAAPLRVAMAGGIRPQKNFPLFCEIARAFEGRDLHFLWLGGGEVPAGVAVPSNVEISGWLPRTEVLRRMAGCHLYMQTSLWEGLPVALLEGMVLGLAVLACPAVGNTELVVEGANGYLCPDAPAFIARLAALERDRASLAALGAVSRELVLRHHDVAHVAPRWLSLYRHYQRYHRFG